MSKNKLGNINFMLFMDLNRNSFPIIKHSNHSIFFDSNLDFSHFIISLIIISCINKYLVKYFIESRYKFNFIIDNLIIFKDPHCILDGSYWTNISIGSDKNMLYLRYFFVSILYFLFGFHLNWKIKWVRVFILIGKNKID